MATLDLSRTARMAIVGALKADVAVGALVPPARVYGPEPPAVPTWPWAYAASPIETPDRLTCTNGVTLSVTVHGFAKGPGDDAASAIGNAIKRCLDNARYQLDGCAIDVLCQQVQIIRDSAEASSYHVLCRFEVRVAAD